MTDGLNIDLTPVGPVSAAFMRAWPRPPGGGAGCVLMDGPYGSGKTQTAIRKMFALALKMPPSAIDMPPGAGAKGIRHFRLGVIRRTYPDLWSKTLPTWNKIFPCGLHGGPCIGTFVGSENRAARHSIPWALDDGTRLHLDVVFRALGQYDDREAVEEALGGEEVTAWIADELAFFPRHVLTYILGRAGRFPDRKHGEIPWYGVVAVFNRTWAGHWLHRYVTDKRPAGTSYFSQPGGRASAAENLANLPRGYYTGQALQNAHDPDFVRRMVDNEWGDRRDGKSVYRNYADHVHRSPAALDVAPGRDILMGGDGGRNPAVVFAQELWDGQIQVLHELVMRGASAETFAPEYNRFREKHFPGVPIGRFRGWGDPASARAGEATEDTWMTVMRARTKTAWRPAPGNNALDPRIMTVDKLLAERLPAGRPRLLISGPGCPVLVGGFQGSYRYREMHGVDVEEAYRSFALKPVKDAYSHPHDAFQNLCLGMGYWRHVLDRPNESAGQTFKAQTEFQP